MRKKSFIVVLASLILAQMPLWAQGVETGGEQGRGYASDAVGGDAFYNEFLVLKNEIGELKVLVVALKDEVVNKRTELNSLQTAIGDSMKALNGLKEQNALLRAEANENSHALASLQQEKTSIQDSLARLRAELTPLQEQRDTVRADIARAQSELAALTRQRDQASGEVAALRKQQEDLQNITARQTAEIAAANIGPPDKVLQPARSVQSEPVRSVRPEPVRNYDDDGAVLDTIYFNPDSTDLAPGVIPMLDTIGDQMLQNPGMKITVRGYSAPAGTADGQLSVSRVRAQKTAAYLMANFDISLERIVIEWVGAADKPRNLESTSDFRRLRAVEVSAAA
ncbi:MAG: OmpA family protein [Spirochaetaceae bacterium]|jgi:outer membrane protein OmpA-like peptidoglycan-associated protein|nr:OmpA family protein [Spirochaetaceae bacterium]